MAARSGASGARSTSELTNKRWKYELPSSPPATSAMRPCYPNSSTRSHPSSRSPASPPTVPSTPVSVTKQLRLAAQPPSYRLVKTQNRGSPTRRGRSHETKLCAHQNASVGPSGDDGAATTAKAASKPTLSGIAAQYPAGHRMHCVKLLGQRLSARNFDRQVVEFQIRVAVLNGFTALGTPITETVG